MPPSEPPIYDAFAPHYERALRPLERLLLTRLRAATLRALKGDGEGGNDDRGNDDKGGGGDKGSVNKGSSSSGKGGDKDSGDNSSHDNSSTGTNGGDGGDSHKDSGDGGGDKDSDGGHDNAGDDNAGDDNAGDGGRLLEIGAGTGLNFPHYPPGARGAATELSREMLRLAQAKPRPAGVHLVQTSAEALPFADDTFDAAFATLVFCSVASPPLAFAELRRVVRAGGRVVLLEHVRPTGLLGLVFDAISFFTVRLCEDHFNRRTADEARRAGLRIVRIEPHALGIIQLIVCEV